MTTPFAPFRLAAAVLAWAATAGAKRNSAQLAQQQQSLSQANQAKLAMQALAPLMQSGGDASAAKSPIRPNNLGPLVPQKTGRDQAFEDDL